MAYDQHTADVEAENALLRSILAKLLDEGASVHPAIGPIAGRLLLPPAYPGQRARAEVRLTPDEAGLLQVLADEPGER